MINKSIIIGGNYGDIPKSSTIINILSTLLNSESLNGGTIDDLINTKLDEYDLILWMANVSNNEEKHYPRKGRGSVLICSKVIHDEVTDIDAVSRIFRMNANAVISIDSKNNPFSFKLIDALGNLWCNTTNLDELKNAIINFYNFTKSSIRLSTNKISNEHLELNDYEQFINLNKLVADKSESMGGRYFGNCSTRCEKMFPSVRFGNEHVLVSKRNVDKSRITCDDLVLVKLNNDVVEYNGNFKPSVDTPVQLKLYNIFPKIKYMIHGHYYIEDAPFTKHYNLCGDVKEVSSIVDVINENGNNSDGVINLKNHGFLIYASDINILNNLIRNSKFIKRPICEELI